MSTKKIVLLSILISILFVIIGWLATPALLEYMVGHLIKISKDVNVISTSIQQQFELRACSALSLMMVPILVMLTSLAIQRFKKKSITNWDYFFYFSIILTVYVLASVFKFYALEATVKDVLNHPIKQGVKSNLPLAQVLVYDWALYGTVIAAVLIALVAKNKK